jgi:hypothetical protein
MRGHRKPLPQAAALLLSGLLGGQQAQFLVTDLPKPASSSIFVSPQSCHHDPPGRTGQAHCADGHVTEKVT